MSPNYLHTICHAVGLHKYLMHKGNNLFSCPRLHPPQRLQNEMSRVQISCLCLNPISASCRIWYLKTRVCNTAESGLFWPLPSYTSLQLLEEPVVLHNHYAVSPPDALLLLLPLPAISPLLLNNSNSSFKVAFRDLVLEASSGPATRLGWVFFFCVPQCQCLLVIFLNCLFIGLQ